jgi:hypothetical protein
MRTLAAAVMAFQSLVIALAIPVAIAVYDVEPARAGWVGGALAVACLLVAGLLRFRWAYAMGWMIQALTILSGFVVPAMFVLGVIFALLWWAALHYGAKGDSAQARFRERIERGEGPDEAGGDADASTGPG